VGGDDLNKDKSESFEAPELSLEHSDLTNLKFDRGASQLIISKTMSASRDGIQHLAKIAGTNFEKTLPNTQKPDIIFDESFRLDLDA
jgi:hypothetical protein